MKRLSALILTVVLILFLSSCAKYVKPAEIMLYPEPLDEGVDIHTATGFTEEDVSDKTYSEKARHLRTAGDYSNSVTVLSETDEVKTYILNAVSEEHTECIGEEPVFNIGTPVPENTDEYNENTEQDNPNISEETAPEEEQTPEPHVHSMGDWIDLWGDGTFYERHCEGCNYIETKNSVYVTVQRWWFIDAYTQERYEFDSYNEFDIWRTTNPEMSGSNGNLPTPVFDHWEYGSYYKTW